MCDDVDNLCDKGLVRGDLVVPGLHKVAQYDGDDGVELQVDVVPARQGRQEVVDRGGSCSAAVGGLLGAEDAADQLGGGPV